MKRGFQIIGLTSLMVLSFFGTQKLAGVIKDSDDIMIKINSVANQYLVEPMNATINENTVVPGLSGSRINVLESYKKMKKIDRFNTDLLIYEKIKPDVSIEDVYNKYIVSGNKAKVTVSLIFLVEDDDNINMIVQSLNKNKASFFVNLDWFEKNNETIMELISKGHTIGNLGENGDYATSNVNWMNTVVTKIGRQKGSYCYNDNENSVNLNRCALNESYTIKPTVVINKNLLSTIKANLSNGNIIAIDNNDINIKELSLTIQYIISKGFNIVSLEKMIEE